MRATVRLSCLLLACAGLASAVLGVAFSRSEPTAPLTPREKAIHALNRLGFGPRPGDVERVTGVGVNAWMERQLNPGRISDAIVEEKLKTLPTLSMSSVQLFDRFIRPIRQAVRAQKKAATAAGGGPDTSGVELEKIRASVPPDERPLRIIEELGASRILRAVYSERQLNEVLVDFWMNHFNVFANKGLDRVLVTAFERETIRPHVWGRFEDLLMATAKSPAMLFYLDNAQSIADLANRPAAAARRTWTRYGFLRAIQAESMAATKKAGGLNENYARELMELHTLGVDGGYTQRDVTELARALTGWSIDRANGEPGGFLFRARVHDEGAKTILGHSLPAGGGIEEGEKMIRALAHHPATAHHIARELCQRLVADDPPESLVDRVARKFLASDGDLRQTVRAVVESPEFFDPQFYRAKIKSPLEYVVSAVRAAGAETDGSGPLLRAVAQMGEPLYLCQPPTGYSDAASAWVNTGALVARLNFALALSANKIEGIRVDTVRLTQVADSTDPQDCVGALARALIGGPVSSSTKETIEGGIEHHLAPGDDPSANRQIPVIAGLILGSPEFQKQ